MERQVDRGDVVIDDPLDRVDRAVSALQHGRRVFSHAATEPILIRNAGDAVTRIGGYPAASVRLSANDASLGMSRSPSWRPPEKNLESGLCVVSFPLRSDGQVFGELLIWTHETARFIDREVNVLYDLASELAHAIAQCRLRADDAAKRQLSRSALFLDATTNLPDRTLFKEQFNEFVSYHLKQGTAFTLLMIGIQDFLDLTEVLGCGSADTLAQVVAQRLTAFVSPDQLLARIGDSEFALTLPSNQLSDAADIAKQVTTSLFAPIAVSDLKIETRVLVGMARFPNDGTEPELLVRRATGALDEARHTMGGYAFSTPCRDQERIARLALLSELRGAIEGNALSLFYQPKVDIETNRVTGVEALLRWIHPVRGTIPTGDLIKLAEQVGLIAPLTRWILAAAIDQARIWQKEGRDLPLAVNLSAHDLSDPRMLLHLTQLMETTALEADRIDIEITETALLRDPGLALETLTTLKRCHFKLFIDDYGAGYAGLSYLQRLPVDAIKIDRSFVADMTSDSKSAAIVSSSIKLGHDLGLDVVAEGVETDETWARLKEMSCNSAQGYLITAPLSISALENWLARRA